jgi:V/A-type H+-transporting ATPase subunit I
MLAPRKMSRLLIAAQKDQMHPVIAELFRRGVFHIEDFVDQGKEGFEGFKIGMPLPGAGEQSSALIKIRGIENTFMIDPEVFEPKVKVETSKMKDLIEKELPVIEQMVEDLVGDRSKLEARKKSLEDKIEELRPFTAVPIDLDLLQGYRTQTVFAGFVARSAEIPLPHETYFQPSKEGNLIVVVAPLEQRETVERILLDAEFRPISIPKEQGAAAPRIDEYRAEIADVEQQMKTVDTRIEEVKLNHSEFLLACDEFISAQVKKNEAPLRFATTNLAFVAEGWVPSSEVKEISDSLSEKTGGKVFVTELPIDIEEHAPPVEYQNPNFAKPTQMLMDIYSRPRYTELDPTLLMAIVFPIFFGFILGDLGYGIILLALSLGLRKFFKGEEGVMLLKVLRNAAISTIIFGVLYSEFFGFELPWHPLLPSRHLNIGGGGEGPGAAIPELLIITIWIGILHITLGRIFGMINHARQDHGMHRTKAILANFGWLLVMWGLLVAIWSAFPIPYMPDLTTFPTVAFGLNIATVIGGVMLIVGVLFIAWENTLEIVEIPTIVSHVLSYARLMAVGLSSVAIALVVNFIAIGMIIEPQLENLTPLGVVLIIFGILILVIGQTLNLVLGIIGGGLHSIRLHYVEFFTKFYKGGGEKYNPFGMKRKFTED